MREKRSFDWATWALMAPAALWLLSFLVLPFIAILVFSFGERAPEGGYQAAFTFAQYANLLSRAAAFKNTFVLAPAGALLCLAVGYPVAYYLAVKAKPRYRLILVSMIIVPFWTSLLVRTYALDVPARLSRHSEPSFDDRHR